MRLKVNNGSHRYDINRTNPGHVHKYTKYKVYLRLMMVTCNKQHEFMEKLSNTVAKLEKSVTYKKSFVFKFLYFSLPYFFLSAIETSGFLTFSGFIERDQKHEMS